MSRIGTLLVSFLPAAATTALLMVLLAIDRERVLRPDSTAVPADEGARMFQRVRGLVARRHVDKVDEQRLLYNALKGMTRDLDHYSTYLTPDEYRRVHTDITGQIEGGLGIRIMQSEDGRYIEVLTPIRGSPAMAAGVQSGDLIVEIDGQSARDLKVDEAVVRLSGPPGSGVDLTLLRYVEKSATHERIKTHLTRRVVSLPSVKGARIEDPRAGIAYVRVTDFQEETAADLREALEDLKTRGMRSLILDLRDNPGGMLDTAVALVDLFVDREDAVIVATRGRDATGKAHRATHRGTFDGAMPMVVLVDEVSASASEVTAGALQDYRRAVVVGAPTFGKGSVQTIFEITPPGGEQSAVKLTTGYYQTPSGRRIHRDNAIDGRIEPDIIVEMSPSARAARDRRWQREDIVPSDETRRRARLSPPRESEPEDAPLRVAVRILRGQPVNERLLTPPREPGMR